MTASADVIGNGVCYDLGKAAYSTDTELPSRRDQSYCWAAGASNIVQYWQDTYYKYKDTDVEVPNGTNSTYGSPTGTMYLNVYQKAYDCGVANKDDKYGSGYPSDFIDWWMKGTSTEQLQAPEDFKGYYNNFFGDNKTSGTFLAVLDEGWVIPTCFGDPRTNPENFKGNTDGVPGGDNNALWENMSNFIKEAFSVQGRALALNLRASHIITCWGYETDESGRVSTLILSDSDDAAFGTFRAQIGIGDTDATPVDEDFYLSYGQRITLSTDDQSALKYPISQESQGHGTIWITSFTYIDTPNEKIAEKNNPSGDVSTGKAIENNVQLTENKTVLGAGIVVGDGAKAVVLTADKDVSLTMDGQHSASIGVTVVDGAMVSLSDVKIENYQGGGVKTEGKAYFHDGQVSILGNSSEGNGGAALNSNYLEFLDCDHVSISNNSATGMGGAICNSDKGTVSFRGNKQVVFSGNTDNGKASDIYNGADSYLNIADNGSVVFYGQDGAASIVNDGTIFLRAQDGKKIAFNNSSLNSDNGTVYVGKDIMFRDNNYSDAYVFDTNEGNGGTVDFVDAGGRKISLRSNPEQETTYSTLQHLSVSAGSIVGAGDNGGIISNALITSLGGLTVSNLKLDTTDTINSLGVAYTELGNVVLTLTDADRDGNMFDLTNVFTGNLTLNNVVFDLSQVTLTGDDLSKLTFDLSNAYAAITDLNQQLSFKTAKGTVSYVQAGSTVLLAATPLPEPTTGTLSLLALAGLAARRRRK